MQSILRWVGLVCGQSYLTVWCSAEVGRLFLSPMPCSLFVSKVFDCYIVMLTVFGTRKCIKSGAKSYSCWYYFPTPRGRCASFRIFHCIRSIVQSAEPSWLYLIGEPENPVTVWTKLSITVGGINYSFIESFALWDWKKVSQFWSHDWDIWYYVIMWKRRIVHKFRV